MSRNSAATAVSRLLDIEPGTVGSEDVIDAVGELSGMIAGGLQNRLADQGLPSFDISLPEVSVDEVSNGAAMVIPFEGPGETVFVELSVTGACETATTDADAAGLLAAFSRRNLLVVDDSAVMRRCVLRALREAGIRVDEVFEAGDGGEALEILRWRPVDLVLCDVDMPIVDGFELVRRARRRDPPVEVPIIMVTTEGREDRIREALSSGVQGYVVKPFTAEDLKEALTGVGI
jgi:two-component system chemotaxis response regulator CheY